MAMLKKSLKDALNHSAIMGAIAGAASVVSGPFGMAASVIGIAGMSLSAVKKGRLKGAAEKVWEGAPLIQLPDDEQEISVETGAPVTAMKTIRLRR
jgi:hypothetical protein